MGLKRILIVEDDMIIQMFLNKIINGLGFDVVGEARTCNQALDKVKELKPEIILMDIGIAGDKDGIITTKLIKETHDVPVLFLTGNSDESTLNRAKEVNPAGFVFKPINENHLKTKLFELNELLDNKKVS